MNKLKIVILLILILAITAVCVSCLPQINTAVKISGDILEVVVIDNLKSPTTKDIKLNNFTIEKTKVEVNGKTRVYNAIDLNTLLLNLTDKQTVGKYLGRTSVIGCDFSIIIVGSDGTSAKINNKDTKGMALYYDKTNKWCVNATVQPQPIKIRDVVEIKIVENIPIVEDSFWGAHIFGDTQDYLVTSAGNLFEQECVTYSTNATHSLNGITVKKGKADLDKKVKISIDDYAPSGLKYLTVFDLFGAINTIEVSGTYGDIKMSANSLSYQVGQTNYSLSAIGISDEINQTIGALYTEAINSLSSGKKVLAIEVDGLSYKQMKYFDVKYSAIKKVYSTYPTKSEVGLATLLSGKQPKDNGVLTAAHKQYFTSDTIFKYCLDEGKTVNYYEGNSVMLPTTPTAIVSQDDTAIKSKVISDINLKGQQDFTYIHFHENDDDSSKYGPYSDKAKAKLVLLRDYINDIIALTSSDTVVYIVSDHGMHNTTTDSAGKGFHTTTTYEDMVVPFITINKWEI